MIQFDDIQDIGIFLSIAFIGSKVGLFDSLYEGPILKTDFLNSKEFDEEYLEKWLLSANSYGFVNIQDDTIYNTELGDRFSKKNSKSELANLIQSIFSILISNEAINFISTGERPGYAIVNKFDKISPWYDYVNEVKNKSLILEILSIESIAFFLKEIKGNIADYSCGNGWFLNGIRQGMPNATLFGVNGRISKLSDIIDQSNEHFFNGTIFYDLIILNKVLHHIWNDNELIKKIISKLVPNGKLLIWEFQWNQEIIASKEYKEIVFLNFVEHIQNAAYINSNEIINKFNDLGFKCDAIPLDNNRQVIYLIVKNCA